MIKTEKVFSHSKVYKLEKFYDDNGKINLKLSKVFIIDSEGNEIYIPRNEYALSKLSIKSEDAVEAEELANTAAEDNADEDDEDE